VLNKEGFEIHGIDSNLQGLSSPNELSQLLHSDKRSNTLWVNRNTIILPFISDVFHGMVDRESFK
jgi:hypothetical protein